MNTQTLWKPVLGVGGWSVESEDGRKEICKVTTADDAETTAALLAHLPQLISDNTALRKNLTNALDLLRGVTHQLENVGGYEWEYENEKLANELIESSNKFMQFFIEG